MTSEERAATAVNSFYNGRVVEIDYVNWRGLRRKRRIVPRSVRYGCTEYHTENQWLLLATCLEKQADLEFAMTGIRGWSPSEDQSLPWR